jgi:putative transposase
LQKIIAEASIKHKTYGYKRLTVALKREYNVILNPKTVHRYRKRLGIKALQPKRATRVKAGLTHSKYAPNLVERKFKPINKNRIWSIDITYVPQSDGTRSYLFAVKDLYDKSIVDYAVSRTMSLPFVTNTLTRAFKNNDTSNLIIHSDQGIHFSCAEYLALLEVNNITVSHSRRGNCLDNAPIESFFALYKKESLWLENPRNYNEAKTQIENYMIYYNQQRIQIGLNGKTPSEFRLFA